jgi:hypothetical protein
MGPSRIIQPVFLVQREPIEELLRYQVWAHAQLQRHLQEVKRCVDSTELGGMTPAGARERLAKSARAMHAATREFAKIAQSVFRPARKTTSIRARSLVPVPHGVSPEPAGSWRQWQWQATHPAAGCLAFEAADWNEQFAVADLWIQRAVHRALAVRATGDYLAVRLDGLARARAMTEELTRQLEYASKDFWARFTLADSIGANRATFAEFAA